MLDALIGNSTIARVIEVSFVLIVIYLVLSNSSGFAQVTRSLGGVYTESVRALQAR